MASPTLDLSIPDVLMETSPTTPSEPTMPLGQWLEEVPNLKDPSLFVTDTFIIQVDREATREQREHTYRLHAPHQGPGEPLSGNMLRYVLTIMHPDMNYAEIHGRLFFS